MIAFALLLAAQAAPAAAATVRPEESDARCLAAFGALGARNSGPEIERAAQLGGLYFYGKLVGRNPRIDLTATMRTAAVAFAADPQGELRRCGAEMQGAGATLVATGRALGGTAPAATPTPRPTQSPGSTPSPAPSPRR